MKSLHDLLAGHRRSGQLLSVAVVYAHRYDWIESQSLPQTKPLPWWPNKVKIARNKIELVKRRKPQAADWQGVF